MITIIMAIYHPNLEWLIEQLKSIENQTYRNIELLIRDDGSDSPVGLNFLLKNLKKTRFLYSVNKENIGSSATFAKLVQEATGDYIAFCDQDDVWEENKLEKLINILSKDHNLTAVYSTLSVIDNNDKKIADDVRIVRKGDAFFCGKYIADKLLIKNCIYGCTLLVRSDIAKSALPLPKEMGHDHWITFWASMNGEVAFINNPLVKYRIHHNNQSKPLKGIETKKAYEIERIEKLNKQMISCLPRLKEPECIKLAQNSIKWCEARKKWINHDFTSLSEFIKYRKISPRAFRFEFFLAFVPQKMEKILFLKIANIFV